MGEEAVTGEGEWSYGRQKDGKVVLFYARPATARRWRGHDGFETPSFALASERVFIVLDGDSPEEIRLKAEAMDLPDPEGWERELRTAVRTKYFKEF